MFEKFTERARQVVVLAQEEARALSHNYIGTEHVLLGLLREQEGLAARVLESLDVTGERVRSRVVQIVGRGEEVTSGQIPFTPRAKKVLELSMRESLSLGHKYIGTEHILLGLVRENEGVASRILLDLDADSEKIRNAVIRMLSSSRAIPREARMMSGGTSRPGVDAAWLDDLRPVLDRLAVEIRGHLGRDPDAGDLLLAFACSPDTLPGQALTELGADLDVLWGTIEHAREKVTLARKKAEHAQEQLARQIAEVRRGKERAIETQAFERAAELRDQERELREQADAQPDVQPEVLQEIRRRLGLPRPDPHPPEAS